jgi:hypothetical protein
MTYRERYLLLKDRFDQSLGEQQVPSLGVRIVHRTMVSAAKRFLPGEGGYLCEEHGARFVDGRHDEESPDSVLQTSGLSVPDAQFTDNSAFRYSLFLPAGGTTPPGTIFLLHGLNERTWHKYLPWAVRLVELTGNAVCLFPIAFHMNRAPAAWGEPKAMSVVASARQKLFPSIACSSFANAAISARLQSIPQRFFWSGVQTYHDVMDLVRRIRSGEETGLSPAGRIDFFAYSIGSFLAQILLMANEGGVFDGSKLFTFCGGPTFDRMYPVSKYIMDSEASIALYAFYVEHLENEFKRDRRLAHFFDGGHSSGRYFKAMLSLRKMKDVREDRFRALSRDIVALALKQDSVIQPNEVMNTLQGDYRDVPVPVHVMDFPHPYSHVNPFPTQEPIAGVVTDSFESVFALAAGHLR